MEQDHVLLVGSGLWRQKNVETRSAGLSGLFVLAANEDPGALGTDFLAVQTSLRDREDVAAVIRDRHLITNKDELSVEHEAAYRKMMPMFTIRRVWAVRFDFNFCISV